MRVTLPATYRLPNGKPMADMVAKLFALQARDVLQYVRSGRTSPINLNGWIDYTTEKLLPFYLWYVAEGWQTHKRRMDAAIVSRGERKSIWSGLMKSTGQEEKEKDDKKKWGLLALIALMGSDVLADVKATVRKVVTGILATSAKQVNVILAKVRVITNMGGSVPKRDVEVAIAAIFTKPSRIKLIGEDEAIRAHHYGMIRVLQQSGYRWMKTWRTAEDELVCPVCRPLNGLTIPMDQTFASLPTSGSYAGIYTLVNAPPAHPGPCRCRIEVFIDVDPAQVAIRPRRELVGV